MQLRETLRAGLKTLLECDVPSAELAAELLLMHTLGRDRSYLYTEPEAELLPETTERYFRLIAERTTGKPTQYITGHQEFWSLDFEVTPDVLIPRPETEHVVEAVLELALGRAPDDAALRPASDGSGLRIVDVGTGSGCIVLALASKLPQASLVATDISYPALAVASRNAARLGLSSNVRFLHGDLLDHFVSGALKNTFDFVVSNPPYVGRDEMDKVQREVREFEPRLAWGVQHGDEIYRRLFPQALEVVKPGGHVVVEVGYNMADAVVKLLGAGWAEVDVRPDLAGIPRVVAARKNRP
ncbi:MAG TPA: peptide chain release factor N(5)-glutamine methyltransferase [Terriglobia bacterium]|nr:peptide chain release factor N(5)-glutamine methyltransferase [Terriglobia bacterium]